MNDKNDVKEFIAKNVASLFRDGAIINLGVGIPTLTVDYLPPDVHVIIHAENGAIGCGPAASETMANRNLVDAANVPITLEPYGCIVDSATSFGAVRGGHIHCTVLGAYQADAYGNLANWLIPGKTASGMGGAMDLVTGNNQVIVATTHTDKHGGHKLLKECSLPLTAKHVVQYIVTELAVLRPRDGSFLVEAIREGVTRQELQEKTGASLVFPDHVKTMVELRSIAAERNEGK